MRLAREHGTGSGEQGKREREARIVVRNLEIDKFHQKYNFILMFILKNLILVKIGTYYHGFRIAYCLLKLKKVRVREREN
jgi:hypothetical protein